MNIMRNGRSGMKIQDMNKEQLIAQMDDLDKQIQSLKKITDAHKKLEAALKASDDRFRFLFDAAPIGLSISNEHGDILSANKTIQEFLGYTFEELKQMNYIDFYADPNERQRLLDKLFAAGHVRDFETLFKHKDGSVWNVLINSDYIDLDKGKVLLTSIHDITQFKQMQKELRDSEERYQILFSNAPVGITVTDLQGNFSASNQAIRELLGYTSEELAAIKISDFYLDKTARQRLIDMSEKYGVVRDFETDFTLRDGKEITVLINTDLIEFEGKKVLLTSIRDITDIKKAEEALTKERDFINAILETADSLILVLDHEGRITRFNRTCEKKSGYTFKDVKHQYIWDVLSADQQTTKKIFQQLLSGNYPIMHENLWKMKNGETRLISWSSTVLPDKNNQIEYIVATGIDITAQRRAETALQEAHDKLSSWVKELEQRNEEMALMGEMGGQLQICQSMNEICAISAQYIQRICPDSHGAIYIINSSRNLAEGIEFWGEPVFTDQVFLPSNCWATRRSGPHLIDKDHPGLRCEHVNGPEDCQYLCVPMMAQGEIMGILHLNHMESDQETQRGPLYTQHKVQLVMNLAEDIALALSNLKLRETLREQSIRDALTGLFNRRYMEETLTRELYRAEREKIPVGVIMLDIDHFKEFNDVSGHDGGDALLRELGVYMQGNIRGGDIVCRFGGEEFFIVLPGADTENTRLRAEEFRKGVKELLVYHLGRPLGKCTISLGVAAYPEHGLTADALIKNADNALYRAKHEGRDKVVVAAANA